MRSNEAFTIFEKSIEDYHVTDDINSVIKNPYEKDDIRHLFYHKNWIDAVQWHLEDIIRDPEINALEALEIKRRIDKSNQVRTDMVEYIDSYFLDQYKNIQVKENARINTESPAWAYDRLSILALKIYHMKEEAERENASDAHRENCSLKLSILMEQKKDLSTAIDELLTDFQNGDKYMKVYKQMKMYNDDNLNPVLRARK
ncbi:DUF4254 domain-containing protein [Lutimonas saemankumensis]|uniref:DUF4254 domain-containing protein n=1 Tax=Lutimonas saemankumensis TaxID=483016 RepID=UPI001CD5FC7C|nr:DUF4254 domain-containing protein [Lutimonas saemankumensis]MCA0933167.1 DUF4254 domain-containing protein [Lutimonas saemankumensis]